MSGSDVKGQGNIEEEPTQRTSDWLGEVERTSRGFEIIRFIDRNDQKCSLQMSSLADFAQPGISAVWLGVGDHRMHLDRKQVRELILALATWHEKGVFKCVEN